VAGRLFGRHTHQPGELYRGLVEPVLLEVEQAARARRQDLTIRRRYPIRIRRLGAGEREENEPGERAQRRA
jgi:hypothetical protein